MDLQTTLIGVFIALLFIFPFVYMNQAAKLRSRKALGHLRNLALQHQSDIGMFEYMSGFSCGLSTNEKKFFAMKKHGTDVISYQVDLTEINHCSLNNINRSVSGSGSSAIVTDSIELVFHHTDKAAGATVVTVYNAEQDNPTLAGELQFAEKWQKTISGLLQHGRKK